MFCMARIVCHLKFEAIANSVYASRIRLPYRGAFVKNSPKITIQKMPRTFVRGTELS